MTIDRRDFLRGTAAFGAAALLGACVNDPGSDDGAGGGTAPDQPPSSDATGSTPSVLRATGEGVLVVVTLAGGNDSLNTVAPVEDGTYRSLRGALALDPAATHDLGDGFALHPALTRTKALWDQGRLAVVHGVGFEGLDRSHFHCMDVWQAGDADDLATGWVGRWLDATGGTPLTAVAVGRQMPHLLRGARTSGAVVPAGPFELPGDERLRRLLAELAGTDPDRSSLASAAAGATADLLSVVDRVGPATAGLDRADTLAGRFATITKLIEADLPTRVYAVELGGFDTHASQAAQHESLLGELDAALGDFLAGMGDRPVTVLAYSEFGRRVAPNASLGTDHGGAGTVLVAGTVRAGHHGEPPPLDRLVGGDLVTTVDFRSVYGGLLEGVLGTEPREVFPSTPAPLMLV